jgi:hypothetical protein
MKRILSIAILLTCISTCSLGQGPQGYWLSDNKNGFFEGLDNMEMRIDGAGNTLSGNVYYIWEHGIYYQDISLEGRTLSGDSVELNEMELVTNRNGKFPGDCKGIFHLYYSKQGKKEYLTGIWKKPPGSKLHCPDSKVVFYRMTPDGSPLRLIAQAKSVPPKTVAQTGPAPVIKAAAPPVAALVVAAPPPDPDSLRWQLFRSRKDSLELVVPHLSDTVNLEFYDDGIIDHDRISLFLGDSLMLKNYELLATPKMMQLILPKGKMENILALYAENEGDIPPNTALMVIYVDDKRFEVRLSSDMKTNAKVVFKSIQ